MQLITPPKYAIAVLKADGSVDELSRWQLRKYIQRCARDKLLLQNKSLRRELKELRNTIPNKGDRLSCWSYGSCPSRLLQDKQSPDHRESYESEMHFGSDAPDGREDTAGHTG